MGKPSSFLLNSLILTLLLSTLSFSQIIFKELPGYQLRRNDSDLFEITETRKIIPLNGKWFVYSADDKEQKKVPVVVPSIFEGEGELVFEKGFQVTQQQLSNNTLEMYFLGVNYTADISINNKVIYRHSGGEFPFSLNLPKDILRTDKNNVVSVRLLYKMDSQNTIPVKQRFLFPKNYGGIFRDVYIQVMPNISISEADISYNYDARSNKVKFTLNSKIDNLEYSNRDTLSDENRFALRVVFLPPSGSSGIAAPEQYFQLSRNKEKKLVQTAELNIPDLWSPSNPQSYTVSFELTRNGSLIDRVNRKSAVYSVTPLEDSLLFNGSFFTIEAVEYVASNYNYGQMFSYDQMERDIRIIKEAGFNTVKFSKTLPHPYYLVLCERMGLLSFIDIPISSIPPGLASDANFIQRSHNYLNNFLKAYKKYSVLAAIGIGSSYVPSAETHVNIIADLAALIKRNSSVLVYASFSGLDIKSILNIDLYGVELINTLPLNYDSEFTALKASLGAGRLMISNASYIVNSGNSDGYVNKYTFEAQAKHYDELIDYVNNNFISGYCISTMFDYRGEYSSLLAGYSKENVYHIGLVDENRSTDRLAFKVIAAKLHNTERVTIPIGTKKDDAPMIFIITGILLAIILGILVNSGRKFREDSSRALLRPYNFYADIRDQRLISGLQSGILAVLVAAVSGLLLSNILYFFKDSILLERVVLSFGSHGIIEFFSYLAWHPFMSILILTALSFAVLVLFTIVIKAGSFFVRNRVFISSIFFTVIWSFLPLVLFIPVGIILYRLLIAEVANIYIYFALILFTVWIFYRLMKGIYVIFDVNAGSVYFYSILFILAVMGGIIIYYQMNNSFIEYLQLSIKQNNIIR